jgi:protein-L-isoaspartate(D-aspartate) O-methyltransferase
MLGMKRIYGLIIIIAVILLTAIVSIRVWTSGIIVKEPPTYLELLRKDSSGQLRAQLFKERQKERDELVRLLTDGSGRQAVNDPQVLKAIGRVPRHAFVVVRHRERAYWDRSMPIEYGQTISQPYIVAIMTELLRLKPGDKVLEIGTGSGYQAAVLGEVTPNVFTVEIIQPLKTQSSELLKLLGYNTIHVRKSDGYYGWPEEAPFQGIIVTAAAGHVPPPLVEQLAPGGRMVIPVGDPYGTQRLILVTKDEAGNIQTEDQMPVRFVAMTGAAEVTR